MARYLVRDPVEINWRVYKRGDIVTFFPKEGEVVTWGTELKEAPVAVEVSEPRTLSALARQQQESEAMRLKQIGLPVENPTGNPIMVPPRPALPPPDPAPTPQVADLLS